MECRIRNGMLSQGKIALRQAFGSPPHHTDHHLNTVDIPCCIINIKAHTGLAASAQLPLAVPHLKPN